MSISRFLSLIIGSVPRFLLHHVRGSVCRFRILNRGSVSRFLVSVIVKGFLLLLDGQYACFFLMKRSVSWFHIIVRGSACGFLVLIRGSITRFLFPIIIITGSIAGFLLL